MISSTDRDRNSKDDCVKLDSADRARARRDRLIRHFPRSIAGVTLRIFSGAVASKEEVLLMETSDLSYELLKYENQWVAILESEQRIVGSGPDAFEAKQDAENHGYSDVLLMRVRDTSVRYAFKLRQCDISITPSEARPTRI